MAKKRPKFADVFKSAEQSRDTQAVREVNWGRPSKGTSKRKKWKQLNFFEPEDLRDTLRLQTLKKRGYVVQLLKAHLELSEKLGGND